MKVNKINELMIRSLGIQNKQDEDHTEFEDLQKIKKIDTTAMI